MYQFFNLSSTERRGYGGFVSGFSEQDVKKISFDVQSIRKSFIWKVYLILISIRKSFIWKVYLILISQLLVTFGLVTLFVYHQPTKLWAYNNSWLFWVALAMLFITIIYMACFGIL